MLELSPEERVLMDEAVAIGRALGRPFLAHEIFAHSRREGYALYPAFDRRLKKTDKRDRYGRAYWIVVEGE